MSGKHRKDWTADMSDRELRERQAALLRRLRDPDNQEDPNKLMSDLTTVEKELGN